MFRQRHTTAVYTQKLIFGAFENPEWVTFGLHRRLGALLRTKNDHIAPYLLGHRERYTLQAI